MVALVESCGTRRNQKTDQMAQKMLQSLSVSD
jgi:hypothetical protein